ncbi:Nucleolar protein 8 [Varanus komodoensis]|nr:Nucleolar protein 8 [Varanus komodoensis]
MEQAAVTKRLYVGGLGHTISEAELQERFGKFGTVKETEIVTRKDEHGNPTKTFAYINITLSEKELKQCISVLNKTKWKGGMLQIELAKESFLHRLAQERQEAKIKREKEDSNGRASITESMKKSGVYQEQKCPTIRDDIIKYDPSRYCHNIKKLDQDLPETVSISQLTWHLEEGDDIISKKRQGQFPVTKKPPKKKMKVQDKDSLSRTELNSCCQFSSGATNRAQAKVVQNQTPDTKKQSKECFVAQRLGTGLTSYRNMNKLSDNAMDSEEEEEIRAIITREKEVLKDNHGTEPEDNVEIVGDEFELKYNTHWSVQKAYDVKAACNGMVRTDENESSYDSADTDEIIAVTRMPNRKNTDALKGPKAGNKGMDGTSEKGILTHGAGSRSSDSNGLILDKQKVQEGSVPEKARYTTAAQIPEQSSVNNKCKSEDGESSDSSVGTSEPDGDYEAVMQSCFRLDLTLEDLERLASEKIDTTDEDDTGSNQSNIQCSNNASPINSTSSNIKKNTSSPTLKKYICPEEIVSALLEESSDEDNPKKKHVKPKVQPFRGIGSLNMKLTKNELGTQKGIANQTTSNPVHLDILKNVTSPRSSDSASERVNHKSLSLKEIKSDSHKESRLLKPDISDTSSAEAGKVESSDVSVTSKEKQSKNVKSLSKRSRVESPIEVSSLVQSKNLSSPLKKEAAFLDSVNTTSKSDTKAKQLQDNERRLTALQERQKERELQKKLIHGALTSVETRSTNKQKHIVFDSDSENEQVVSKEGCSGEPLGKGFTTKTSGKLFESSEEDSDTADEEDRFRIKPQFEGKTGEKLLHLQSRFGTDERFRMDARFLESDSEQEDESNKLEMDKEEELTLEKKKNLEILQSLLHIGVEPPKPSKLTANTRKFKDMNTVRYDPTRQEHAVFERKPEKTEKESKAKTKKKKEEVQKLPEVSGEIFYSVAVDLKEVFGSKKCDGKTAYIPWDKHEDVKQANPADAEALTFSAGGNDKEEENSGFAFSFFGAEEESSPMKEEPYVIETIKPSRVTWQEDPRFQDSSSEDDPDDPEVVESKDVTEMSSAVPHSNIRFFFFSKDDIRLKEGPKLFCKSSNTDEDAEDWESRRQMLLEDCRKKHKDARRKVKAK